MPELSTIAVFCLAALGLLVIPGPAVFYIVTRSLDQGRAAGLVSVLGVHCGSFVHIFAAALGVSALVASSTPAFGVVKYAGAAYLIYLGIRRLLESGSDVLPESAPRSLKRIFVQGMVVNVLNPKTALFFFAFLPQFVDPARGPVPFQIAFFGLLFVLLGMLSDGTYALVASGVRSFLRGDRSVATARRFIGGGMYLTLGVAAAFSGAKTSD